MFRPSTGNWHSHSTESKSFLTIQWSLSTDVLVPADYDGDGLTDIAVYRGGTWFIYESSTLQLKVFYYGAATDIPLDFLNVKRSIVAVP